MLYSNILTEIQQASYIAFLNASTGRKRANLMPEVADEIFLHISYAYT